MLQWFSMQYFYKWRAFLLPFFLFSILLVSGAFFYLFFSLNYPGIGEDIHAVWRSGMELSEHKDPYRHILETDMLHPNGAKFPTYLPGPYYFAAATSELFGLNTFEEWILVYKKILLIFTLGVAGLIFYIHFNRRDDLLLCVFGAMFWLFNRWTIKNMEIYHIDIPALFFLILSLSMLGRRNAYSFLLYGVSLSIKQVGALMFPLYLFEFYKIFRKEKMHAIGLLLLGVYVPLVLCIPFLIKNPKTIFLSLIFHLTRAPEEWFNAPSFDAYITWKYPFLLGATSKPFLIILLIIFYIYAFRSKLGKYSTAFCVFSIFIFFNTVLFPQYFVWNIPFITLAITEICSKHKKDNSGSN